VFHTLKKEKTVQTKGLTSIAKDQILEDFIEECLLSSGALTRTDKGSEVISFYE